MKESKYKSGVTRRLDDKGLITPPKFVPGGLQYETIMGSMAYGVSSDASDVDIYGFCIPPKDVVFPHLAGKIEGFGRQQKAFGQFQAHHVKEEDRQKEYDLNIYNIVKYFHLCMENNPNMIDSLFTAPNMVLCSTKVSDMVRDSRKIFLHKGSWFKFKGYAYAQMKHIQHKTPDPNGKRYWMTEKYGYDVKFAYHIVRLLNEVEQIMSVGDIDLMQNREQLKSVRNGEWSIEELKSYFVNKEQQLEQLYISSSLRNTPDEKAVKQLLIDCLEEYYGDLESCIVNVDEAVVTLKKVKELIEKGGY